MTAGAGPIVPHGRRAVGLVLAAGAGRRMGGPKALVTDEAGQPWVVRAARTLCDGGCAGLVVVVGAEAERVAAIVNRAFDRDVTTVYAPGWRRGMGASLRTGLDAVRRLFPEAPAVLVGLVDTPGVSAEVVRRVLDAAPISPSSLARAQYHGNPGHPVLLGRDHWSGIQDAADGDVGARAYLADRLGAVDGALTLIECGDLADGADIDHPPA
ncbi:MAG: nucleotidyltransferase family protein [Kineosporiaceae bacterium]